MCSYLFQSGWTVVSESAQRPVEHFKDTQQNVMTDRMLHSVAGYTNPDLPVNASSLHGEDARPGVHEVRDDLAARVGHDALGPVTLVAVTRERGWVF